VAVLVSFLIGVLFSTLSVRPAKAGETIYIRPGGNVDPPTAPILRIGDVYAFTDDIYDSIIVQRSSIILDGAGHTLEGPGAPFKTGIGLSGLSNVTITNMTIRLFDSPIYILSSSGISVLRNNIVDNSGFGVEIRYSANSRIVENNISRNNEAVGLYNSMDSIVFGNNIDDNHLVGVGVSNSNSNRISTNFVANSPNFGIWMDSHSSRNTIFDNSIVGNYYGVFLHESFNNSFYHNNFIDNTNQAHIMLAGYGNSWDSKYPSCGNYWSDYTDEDSYCGPDQDILGSDGVWDQQYILDPDNRDRYPLVDPHRSGDLSTSIYTDKYRYDKPGETMLLGLNVTNPDSVKHLCFAVWLELPNHSIHPFMHNHSVVLPIGIDYNNPSFETIILPATIPGGIYKWHAAFLERATHEIVAEDTAEWEFFQLN
ncbi:MAG: right-handed parallel beta-helix repeat-containing protein, partial [Candidatus Bathyarchaeota archaeon]